MDGWTSGCGWVVDGSICDTIAHNMDNACKKKNNKKNTRLKETLRTRREASKLVTMAEMKRPAVPTPTPPEINPGCRDVPM